MLCSHGHGAIGSRVDIMKRDKNRGPLPLPKAGRQEGERRGGQGKSSTNRPGLASQVKTPSLWFSDSGSTRYTQITSVPYRRASRVHVIQKMLLGTGVTLVILELWKQRQEDHKTTSQAEPPRRLSVNNTDGRTEYLGIILWSQC